MKTIVTIIASILFASFNISAQYSCSNAVAITSGYVSSSAITSPGTSTSSSESWVSTASTDGNTSSNGWTRPDVYLFKYTTGSIAGESFYFTINCDYNTDGEHSIGVWTGCSGSTLSSCVTSTYKFKNVVGVCAQNLTANTTYYIGVGKEWAYSGTSSSDIATRKLKFNVIEFSVETTLTAPSDECATASIVNVADPYTGSTRCSYSASTGSPSSCGSIENDSWMKFVAGSSIVVIDYGVSNCTGGYGVQLSVFSGSCSSLTFVSGSCINYASNNSTGTWTFTGLTVNNTYYIRTDGYAGDLCSYSFNPVSGVAILPIELSNFSTEAFDGSLNKIKWTTESEANSDYFELEKSTNGTEFTFVSKIIAQGNSSSKLNYFEFDESSSSLTTYYRLKMVDNNGHFFYSEIKSVTNLQTELISVYPNPSSTGIFNLNINSKDSFSEILIFSQEGKLIEQISKRLDQNTILDMSHLPAGSYTLKIANERTSETKRLLIID
jgi:hypothetical protein